MNSCITSSDTKKLTTPPISSGRPNLQMLRWLPISKWSTSYCKWKKKIDKAFVLDITCQEASFPKLSLQYPRYPSGPIQRKAHVFKCHCRNFGKNTKCDQAGDIYIGPSRVTSANLVLMIPGAMQLTLMLSLATYMMMMIEITMMIGHQTALLCVVNDFHINAHLSPNKNISVKDATIPASIYGSSSSFIVHHHQIHFVLNVITTSAARALVRPKSAVLLTL